MPRPSAPPGSSEELSHANTALVELTSSIERGIRGLRSSYTLEEDLKVLVWRFRQFALLIDEANQEVRARRARVHSACTHCKALTAADACASHSLVSRLSGDSRAWLGAGETPSQACSQAGQPSRTLSTQLSVSACCTVAIGAADSLKASHCVLLTDSCS